MRRLPECTIAPPQEPERFDVSVVREVLDLAYCRISLSVRLRLAKPPFRNLLIVRVVSKWGRTAHHEVATPRPAEQPDLRESLMMSEIAPPAAGLLPTGACLRPKADGQLPGTALR